MDHEDEYEDPPVVVAISTHDDDWDEDMGMASSSGVLSGKLHRQAVRAQKKKEKLSKTVDLNVQNMQTFLKDTKTSIDVTADPLAVASFERRSTQSNASRQHDSDEAGSEYRSSDGFSDRVRTRRNIPGLERQSGYGFSSGFASSGFVGDDSDPTERQEREVDFSDVRSAARPARTSDGDEGRKNHQRFPRRSDEDGEDGGFRRYNRDSEFDQSNDRRRRPGRFAQERDEDDSGAGFDRQYHSRRTSDGTDERDVDFSDLRRPRDFPSKPARNLSSSQDDSNSRNDAPTRDIDFSDIRKPREVVRASPDETPSASTDNPRRQLGSHGRGSFDRGDESSTRGRGRGRGEGQRRNGGFGNDEFGRGRSVQKSSESDRADADANWRRK